jgi:hypothetical protein
LGNCGIPSQSLPWKIRIDPLVENGLPQKSLPSWDRKPLNVEGNAGISSLDVAMKAPKSLGHSKTALCLGIAPKANNVLIRIFDACFMSDFHSLLHNLVSHCLEAILEFADVISLLKVFHRRAPTIKQIQFANLMRNEDTVLQHSKGLEILISD